MNIHINSPIGSTGYGNTGLNLTKALSKTEHNICLTPIGHPNIENDQDLSILQDAINKQSSVDYNATCIKIWHQFDLLSRIGKGKYFAYPFFELDTFNDREKHHLNFPDEIIVSSQWAIDILKNNNIKQPVSIVNPGVDLDVFQFIKKPDTENFIFITIGKWEIRKSHDIIIECFNKAFDTTDKVELWMLTHNPFLNSQQENQWLSLVTNAKLKQKIKIFPRLRSHKEVAEAISYADCGLYISRAEGWNLGLLETMAMNKPVIATNYSAHTEYVNSKNSYIVDITDTEPAIDNMWFFGNGNWAKITEQQKEQTIEHMRHVYKNKINTNHSGIETAKLFTWENSAKQLIRCIGS